MPAKVKRWSDTKTCYDLLVRDYPKLIDQLWKMMPLEHDKQTVAMTILRGAARHIVENLRDDGSPKRVKKA